jgi:hypothetical protein
MREEPQQLMVSIATKMMYYSTACVSIITSFLDLHLAAELGKALLETNRELETQSIHLHQVNHEQSLEIEVFIFIYR